MCYLITFALPKPIEAGQAVHPLNYELFENQGGGHVYDADWSVYALTAGGCSCDLVNLIITDATQAAELEKVRTKYEKKGWSKAKIERAMADKIGATAPIPPPLRADAADFLSKILREQGRLDLLIHWHRGDFNKEPFEITETVLFQSAAAIQLDQPQEDIKYRFTTPKGKL